MTLDEIVADHYDKLNENDLYVWQYISHHKIECQKMSIQELAYACNVSHTSILRFAKKLGLEGYSELKVHIKWSLKQNARYDNKALHRCAVALKETIDMMETADFDRTLQYLDQAQRIFIYATGEVQYHVAQELKREFIYNRKIMHIIEGEAELDTVLNRANQRDVFIILSLSGTNLIAITLAKVLKKMKIPSIGIALNTDTLLSKNCSEFIGFKTSYFDSRYFDKRYCCTGALFIIANLLFLRYMEYCSLKDA